MNHCGVRFYHKRLRKNFSRISFWNFQPHCPCCDYVFISETTAMFVHLLPLLPEMTTWIFTTSWEVTIRRHFTGKLSLRLFQGSEQVKFYRFRALVCLTTFLSSYTQPNIQFTSASPSPRRFRIKFDRASSEWFLTYFWLYLLTYSIQSLIKVVCVDPEGTCEKSWTAITVSIKVWGLFCLFQRRDQRFGFGRSNISEEVYLEKILKNAK